MVHEGKPLYGDDNDHSMEEEAERQLGAPASSSASLARRQPPIQSGPSSLAKASGGVIPVHHRPRISSQLVVDEHADHSDLKAADFSDDDGMACSPPRKAPPRKASPLQTRLVIGGEPQAQNSHASHNPQQYQHHTQQHVPQHHEYEVVERMEGVELHHGPMGPLVVMDGANIAYAYADALSGLHQGSSEPDARGISVAASYFLSMDVRVLVVIPAPWFRVKPRAGDELQGMY